MSVSHLSSATYKSANYHPDSKRTAQALQTYQDATPPLPAPRLGKLLLDAYQRFNTKKQDGSIDHQQFFNLVNHLIALFLRRQTEHGENHGKSIDTIQKELTTIKSITIEQIREQIKLGKNKGPDEIKHFKNAFQRAIALEALSERDSKYWQFKALIQLGHATRNDQSSQIAYYNKALELSQNMGDKGQEAQARIGLGNARCGNLMNQKQNYETALKLAKKLKNRHLQRQANTGLENIARIQRQGEKAHT